VVLSARSDDGRMEIYRATLSGFVEYER